MSLSKIYKGSHGWTGETSFPGDQDEYTWKITTLKRSSGKIASYATAWQYEDGSLVWNMFRAPKIELGEVTGSATEATVKAEHYKAVAIFEQKLDAGEVPQRDQPKPGSGFSANTFGLTESEGDGDSHIGDAWKDALNNDKQDEPKAPGIIVDKAFFTEHRLKIKGSVQNDANLLAGFNFVDKATAEGADWSTYSSDEFVKQMTDQFFRSVTPVLKATKPYLFKEPDRGYTGYRWEGSAYKNTRGLATKDIAALAREEYKVTFPEMKWSVTTDVFSGGASISANGTNYPHNPYAQEFIDLANELGGYHKARNHDRYHGHYKTIYSAQYLKDEAIAKNILEQYRFSDSDGQIDYFNTNFYDHVDINTDDWDAKLFADRKKEVEDWKQSSEKWDAQTKKRSEEAAKVKQELGLVPKWTIVKYTRDWNELGKKTISAIITKAPNGRSRWSMDYDIRFIPPEHPKKGYAFKDKLTASISSIELDKDAAAMSLAEYKGLAMKLYGYTKQDQFEEYYGKRVESAWKNARQIAGIVDQPKAQKKVTQPDKKPVSTKPIVSASDIEFNVVAGKHTKTGSDIWTVTMTGRVSAEDFNELRNKAKAAGAYYSSFRGNGAVPGFIFKDEASANTFAGADSKPPIKAPKGWKKGDTLEKKFKDHGMTSVTFIEMDQEGVAKVQDGNQERFMSVNTLQKAEPEPYGNWYEKMLFRIQNDIGVDRSDATGMLQAKEFELQQAWTEGLNAQQTFERLFQKNEAPGTQESPISAEAFGKLIHEGVKEYGWTVHWNIDKKAFEVWNTKSVVVMEIPMPKGNKYRIEGGKGNLLLSGNGSITLAVDKVAKERYYAKPLVEPPTDSIEKIKARALAVAMAMKYKYAAE